VTDSNRDVISKLQDAYRSWDVQGLRAILADDVVFNLPGRNPFSGVYRGPDAVLDLWSRQRDYMDGRSFHVSFIDVLVSEQHVVAITSGEGTSAGGTVATRGCDIFTLADGRITEFWPLFGDMESFDRFWSEGQPTEPSTGPQ
jgi:ketosteroid isomerase-like protein